MKYIEIGIGNRWLVRTETEFADGSEKEEKGIIRPIKFHSLYLRIWAGKRVIILSSREGIIHMKKKRNQFKLIFGLKSY
ncbi:DUF3977 family protein [Sporolactobacillus vineae]|uniref:DUF3977 family protein n=1 Tax=Sporolactobacillus vineae TaxID=444463 RepID=UPI000288544F|nr:DUF3977 family protein [Sporolactobacillus vineae]